MGDDGGAAPGGGPRRVRFFVSYTGADRAWAERIAWELEDAGWTTVLQAWDFVAGENFVGRMNDALAQAELVLAIYSPAYFRSKYCTDEWTAALVDDGRGGTGWSASGWKPATSHRC